MRCWKIAALICLVVLMGWFNRNGVWFRVKDGTAADVERYLRLAENDLATLKASTPDAEVRHFLRPNMWRIVSTHDRDEIQMIVRDEKIEKEEKKKKIQEKFETFQYVLLVEMISDPMTTGVLPGAFAIFAPSGQGTAANQRGGGINLELVGWTNGHLPESQDPPGLVEQTTYRQRWCLDPMLQVNDPVPPHYLNVPLVGVEQCYRVDQGYLAYDGEMYDAEEVTNIYYDSFWSYENIPHPTVWETVDPGPPPEDVCGYTWTIAPEYGGSPDGDYHDELHLFYMVKVGNELAYWWPPEFNQHIVIKEYYNVEGGAFRGIDYDYDGWDEVSEHGIESVEEILFPNTISAERVTSDGSKRVWGGVYVRCTDRNGSNEFPYTSFEYMPFTIGTEPITDYTRIQRGSGVYLYDRWQEIFIQGYRRLSGSRYYINGFSCIKREPADPEALPYGEAWEVGMAVGNYFTRFQHPEDLTERQLILLQGNEESSDDWRGPDPFDNLYHAHLGENIKNPAEVVVNCGGEEYIVEDESVIESVFDPVTNYTFNYVRTFQMIDHGIFTKVGTGISEGEVDHGAVEPVYAFSLEMFDERDSINGDVTAIYGMVIDGQLYRTAEFARIGYQIYNVPGTAAAVDQDGNGVQCSSLVRIGVMKTRKTTEIEVPQ
jgi:hypothetical protein